MKKILIGMMVVLVLIGVWFISSDKKDDVTEDTNTPVATTTDTTAGGTTNSTVSKPVTFKSLLSQKGNFECKYEQVDPNFRSTNVVYLSDGKMRAEFRTMPSTGSSISNLMVYDGQYLYVWKEGMPTGTRTQPKSISELPDVIPADITSAAVYGTSPLNVSYDCHPWSKVPSMLVKPAYVKF